MIPQRLAGAYLLRQAAVSPPPSRAPPEASSLTVTEASILAAR